ncbi:MAG: flagellar basal body rod protein FlgB [Ignavibacteriaceae bacterium]
MAFLLNFKDTKLGANIRVLEDFIDYCSLRNKVISKNIANIGTQNYKREDVVFKDLLNDNMSLLKTTDPKHFGQVNFESKNKITVDNSKDMVSGINNVNIDEEMAELAKNTLQFKLASKKLGDYFKILQGVIKGGGF